MNASIRLKANILRAVGASLFIMGGGWLTLMSMLAGPSFWYFPCSCALFLIGLVWIWRPPLAAALSVGPLLSVLALTQYPVGYGVRASTDTVVTIAAFLLAVLIVVVALRNYSGWKLPVALSLIFVASVFGTDRLFTNKVSVRRYEMHVAVNGHAPWGDVGPEWSDGIAPIVVYRRVGDDYCYDAFKSEELRQRLAQKEGSTVTVEYNIFSDFGRERSYNVRSVDGLLLNDQQRTVRDFERFGGQVGSSNLNCR